MAAMDRDLPAARRRALARIAAEVAERAGHPSLPGTILARATRCGRPGCGCTADPPRLHGPYRQWTRKQDGRTVTRLLSPEQAERYQPWVDNAHRLRDLLRQLEALGVAAAEAAEGWAPPPGRPAKATKAASGKARRPKQ
jgi:hypothetical protein